MDSKKSAAIKELLETERSYVQGLQTLSAVFSDPIKLTPKALLLRRAIRNENEKTQKLLTNDEISRIFSNVDTLLTLHVELLRAFEERQNEGNYIVGDLMLERAPFLKMYSLYLNNYQVAMSTLKMCQETNADFSSFLEIAHRDSRLSGLNIVAFLLLPVQRIPRSFFTFIF